MAATLSLEFVLVPSGRQGEPTRFRVLIDYPVEWYTGKSTY